jgi:intracellular sulfur oxidation DsrE/DsrF family protein
MKKPSTNVTARRALLGSLGAAALAGVAVGSAQAAAQEQPVGFVPQRHDLDAWMDALPGTHRVFIDSDSNAGGTNALRYAANIMNAHVNAYEGKDADMAIIICYRHASTGLGFNDAMWEKYGKTFATLGRITVNEGEAPPSKNPQLETITQQAARGMHFAICNSASTLIASFIARDSGQEQAQVLAELVANTIPNGHMVPAGVMALTRAQEYGYSFLYSAA